MQRTRQNSRHKMRGIFPKNAESHQPVISRLFLCAKFIYVCVTLLYQQVPLQLSHSYSP